MSLFPWQHPLNMPMQKFLKIIIETSYKIRKNEKKIVKGYGHFIAKKTKYHEFLFDISSSLKMFVINEGSFWNVLNRQIKNDNLNMSSTPKN